MKNFANYHKIALAGLGVAGLGNFLPWATITSIFGTMSVSGMNGDGKIILPFVIITAIVTWFASNKITRIIATVLSGLLAAVSLYEWNHINSVTTEATDGAIMSTGIGVYALVVGSVVAFALNGARINETATDEVAVAVAAETVDA